MKIKVYMVTYNFEEAVNNNLRTLFDNMDPSNDDSIEVHIINNHTNFKMNKSYPVTVIHNVLQPDWGTGHIARNWNQSLIHGFKNLNQPDADIVCLIQDDMRWTEKWVSNLKEIHKRYSFYSCSWGDAFHSYTAEGVKSIGIWDERYCNIAFQEADYLLRALFYNKEKSSVNDNSVGRKLNLWGKSRSHNLKDPDSGPFVEELGCVPDFIATRHKTEYETEVNYKRSHDSGRYNRITLSMFEHKWPGIKPEFWAADLYENPRKPAVPTYMFYPYFEEALYDLPGKGYLFTRIGNVWQT